ncbi:EF-P beta-lysylation protein EpmB [Thalassoglobus polymorphus]|uniref:L-lysine 2,3-aminomutase n=1 Tax=Thalassoglobus polymorphus TaxID=2527994 RepID=A0A517QRI4_9PLAN|nr:EF-P beta-lysylation protein EpmB [Thalassoglobus polymorphus]QDT34237.1 L-lysine 2,3-aminomutase [Thalassoglobus polymorphus]
MPATPQMLPDPSSLIPTSVTEIDVEASGATIAGSKTWQHDLKRAIRSVSVLCERLGIDPNELKCSASPAFPVLVPESFLKRMKHGDRDDPLLRQVLPVSSEEEIVAGFQADPVGDLHARTENGLLQKYNSRGLLILNGACAVHCRYCFRREYPYSDEPKSLEDWEPAFAAIESDRSLDEVILSGGDPLMTGDARLQQVLNRLERIKHVERVRFHSRLPIVLPSRVNSSLLKVLKSTRLQPVFVVHANHPSELVDDCADSLQKLVRSGIPVLNQAVLLKGVNDSFAALSELCLRCVNLGVMPYYLHQLDRVSGAAHFEVPVEVGLQLIRQLREHLPGYAVPKYVQEIAGERSKTPLVEKDTCQF